MKGKLEKVEAKMKEIADRYNKLEQEKQELLKEALRLEGEARVLKELLEEQ